MSFVGKVIEILEPEKEELYEPKQQMFLGSLKKKYIRRKPVIKLRPDMPFSEPVNILGKKRHLVDAFGLEIYNDKERYGQDIPVDFFTTNVGHGVSIDLYHFTFTK